MYFTPQREYTALSRMETKADITYPDILNTSAVYMPLCCLENTNTCKQVTTINVEYFCWQPNGVTPLTISKILIVE